MRSSLKGSRFFKKKMKRDLEYVYWSIGEDLDTESKLPKDGKNLNAPPFSTPPTTIKESHDMGKLKQKGSNEDKNNFIPIVGAELEPTASGRKSLRSKEQSNSIFPSFFNLGGSIPRTDSPCEDVTNGRFVGSENKVSPTKQNGGEAVIPIPNLSNGDESTSFESSSTIGQRRLPLLGKKNKYFRGGLLSNPVHTPINEVGGDGEHIPTAFPSTSTTPLQKLNSRTSRNWSEEPPAPHRWHQVRDADDDTADGEEFREEDVDDYGLADPLVDDLCNQSRPVGCVSIAVTAGIAALWLL